MSSLTLLNGTPGFATSRLGVTPASVMGAKSFVTSKAVLYSDWMTEKGSAAPKSV